MSNDDRSPARSQPARYRLVLIALTLFLAVSVCIPFASAACPTSVALSGTPRVGQVLTATVSPSAPSGTNYDFDIYYDSSCIVWRGALQDTTSNTILLGSGTTGYYIHVRAHDMGGCVPLYSSCVGPIAAAYTVTYNANGGSGAVPTDSTYYPTGASVTLLPNGTLYRNGYAFNGWNLTTTRGVPYAAGSTYTMGSSNAVFYANWSRVYSVTYNANGGSGAVPIDSSLYRNGAPVTLLPNGTLYKNGYTFNGWNLTSTTGLPYTAGSTYTMGSSNTVFYANWSLTPATYTVTYHGNGNDGGTAPIDSNLYNSGNTVTVMTEGSLSLTDYHFTGWNTQADGGGIPYAASSTFPMGSSNVDLYAQWARDGPVVTGLDPIEGPIGGGTTVTISGNGFLGTSAVQFGTTYATILTVSADTITVTSPGHALGTVDVTVTTAGGTSATSSADQFTYIGPTVTGISPTSGSTAGGDTVTISGSGFLGTSAVQFGTTYATILTVSADTITVTSPGHALGTVDVTVTSPGGTSATSSADQFTYIGTPVVTGISPTSGPTAGGDTVTISGSDFLGTSAVQFGTTYATILTVSADTITVTSPGHALGTVDVTVTTAGGTSATSPADQFTYGGPAVTGISPTSGSTAGGETVTISGSSFLGTSAVQFGTTYATILTVSADTITVTSPGHVLGTVDVTVTTAGGTSATSPADQFTYIDTPVVTGISPTSGSTAGGETVTISGSSFLGTSAVQFGTTYATILTVSADTITVTSPGHASAGTVDVKVTTAGGTSATSPADQFTYS